ncbi:MAG: general secretion pathway protein G [Planctomycetota bacterium]|jgi:general secretion pathway protein G
MKLTTRSTKNCRAGFTLLEMIIVVSIMAIVAGAAIPLASAALKSKARRATVTELQGLQEAAEEYFRDTDALPTSVASMEQNPVITGWTGPYLAAFSLDRNSGLSQYAVDAWSQPYKFKVNGSLLTITSAGVGGAFGDGNDHEIILDVTRIRREKSLETLKIVNQAIQLYNAAWLSTDPLPASYPNLLSKLVARGYLPSTAPFSVDGWGSALVVDPPLLTPAVMVTSSNFTVLP